MNFNCKTVLSRSVLHLVYLIFYSDFESVGRENEDLIAHLSEDDYELVYPTQIRDKIRVGIDTQNHFFKNAVSFLNRQMALMWHFIGY